VKVLSRKIDTWFESIAVGRRFLPELRQNRWRMFLITLLSLALTALDLARPWPIQWVVDNALATKGRTLDYTPMQVIWIGVIASGVIMLAYGFFNYVTAIQIGRVGHDFSRGLRFRIFSHLSTLSPLFHAKHKSGDLLVRMMGDVPMVSTMMVDSAIDIATRLILIVGTVGMMVYIDPWMTLTVFSALPVLLLIVRWLSKQIHVTVKKQRRKEGELADYLHEAIAATQTIQSLGGSEHVVRRFARNNRRSERAGLKAKKLSARLSVSVDLLMGIGIAGVLFVGSLRVLHGDLRLGELLVFLTYLRNISKPLRAASRQSGKIAKGTACGERILAILDEVPEVTSRPGAEPAPEEPRELGFEHVSFAYTPGVPALADFDARFHRGQLTALVGRSGAGKSTAASLAMRLFDPQEGRVTLDGKPLDSLELKSTRERIGLSLQRTVLFGESLRENLLLASPEADDDTLWKALEEAGAAEFVRALPDGLDAQLGSNGVGLSGGQQSRISLARTLLRQARVLIVDEPFAGLDRLSARQVSETLHKIAHDKVVVVIAHDLERLDLYDRIVFMEKGTKVDEGTHEELLERLPLYREVVRTTAQVAS